MDARHIVLSPDSRRVSKSTKDLVDRNVMSAAPSDDFTVRVTNQPSAPYPGYVFIGFTTRAAFTPDTDIVVEAGVYTLYPRGGMLFGSGKRGTAYCAGFTHGTVRCVADRGRGTIAFHVDGVDRGVAWTDVAPGPLHAVVVFYYPGVDVELL